ncbi:MAG: GNAT family N-acetyltransferase [Chloroflexota bacterium]
MSDVIIHPARVSDAEALYDLRLTALKTNPEAFGSDWQDMEANQTVASYATTRIPPEDSDKCLIVAEQAGRLVGMMGFVRGTRLKTKHTGDIWGVFVRPDARRQGISNQMMTALMAHIRGLDSIKQVKLSVIADNTAAIALYQKFGFETWGTLPKGLYVDGVYYDMLYMSYIF